MIKSNIVRNLNHRVKHQKWFRKIVFTCLWEEQECLDITRPVITTDRPHFEIGALLKT